MHTNIFVEISEVKKRLGRTAQKREHDIEQASVEVPLSSCIQVTLCSSPGRDELYSLRILVDFLSPSM
jgi:hypothetical protein